jgi:hypothetical protein
VFETKETSMNLEEYADAREKERAALSGVDGLGRGEQAGSDFVAISEKLDTMRLLLSDARIRLDQYIGMCGCPGMPCVTACRECDATQDLVNRIRAFMQGR